MTAFRPFEDATGLFHEARRSLWKRYCSFIDCSLDLNLGSLIAVQMRLCGANAAVNGVHQTLKSYLQSMNAPAFYAVMMFQPRSRQQFTALTQSDDLARVYRDDAVRDSEMRKWLTITKRDSGTQFLFGGLTQGDSLIIGTSDRGQSSVLLCIISTPGFDLRQGQVTLSTRIHGVFVEAPAGKHAATALGGLEKEGLSRL